MHARTTRLGFVDSTSAAAIRAWEKTMELARLEPGFIEAILLVRPETHEAISISVWDTKDHCEATGRTGPGTLIEKAVPILRPFLRADPIFTQYEVCSRLT